MSSVIVFDVRNFSAHREFLSNEKKAKLLSKLVKVILNTTVTVTKATEKHFGQKSNPVLNHTGDGFVVVLKGRYKALMALFFVSTFRSQAKRAINEYHKALEKVFPANKLPRLGFGIGIHNGLVETFWFKDFNDKEGDETRNGFLGHVINVASRVEQLTKNKTHQVICTLWVKKEVSKLLKNEHRKKLERFFVNLGPHPLRGIKRSYTLFGVKNGLHREIKPNMLIK